jgi:hypothetical protein
VLMILIISIVGGCLYRRCRRNRGTEGLEDEAVKLEQKLQARWERVETKLKALAAFLQIVLNISFTCTVQFPIKFQSVLTTLSVFNLEILPSLGIQCWFNAYDCEYISQRHSLGRAFLPALFQNEVASHQSFIC